MASFSANGLSIKDAETPITSIDLGGAEILDWSDNGYFAAVTGGDEELRIVGYNKAIKNPKLLFQQELGSKAQSVAIQGNRLAVAVSDNKTEQGNVQIYRWNSKNGKLKEIF